jgi:glycosyltransferase involved in cell wall biosynthesis
MVQLLLERFGGDARGASAATPTSADGGELHCYHVNCRFSDTLEEIGRMRAVKLGRLFKYCAEALWCRWRYGAADFYFVPAPGARAPVARDWLVMLLCRPFFRRRIYHWHAAGLSEWLEKQARPWERVLTRWLLSKPALSLVLSEFGRRDGLYFRSARTEVVPNGIPDPCPKYGASVHPLREGRAAQRAAVLAGAAGPGTHLYEILFISLCTREKGLFDTLEAVVLLNRKLAAQGARLRVRLNVAGKFMFEREQAEFEQRAREAPELRWPATDPHAGASDPSPTLNSQLSTLNSLVQYHGFVTGADKERLFRENDCLCFPTSYAAESFGLVLVEAMAFGLEIVTTHWRGIPELLPAGYPGIVAPQSPEQIAAACERLLAAQPATRLREHFLANYTADLYAERIRAAILRHE